MPKTKRANNDSKAGQYCHYTPPSLHQFALHNFALGHSDSEAQSCCEGIGHSAGPHHIFFESCMNALCSCTCGKGTPSSERRGQSIGIDGLNIDLDAGSAGQTFPLTCHVITLHLPSGPGEALGEIVGSGFVASQGRTGAQRGDRLMVLLKV